MREVVAIVPLVLGLVASGASSAPARYCKLLVDDGKELPEEQAAPGSASDVTLLSADIATDARAITMVVRVRALPDVPTYVVKGATYRFGFSVSPEHHFYGEARLGARHVFELYNYTSPWYGADEMPEGNVFVDRITYVGPAAGVVDTARDEVRMTVPISMLGLGPGLRRGTKINYLGASSMRTHGDADVPPPGPPTFVGYHEDGLSGGKKLAYPAGAPSCVVVGR